MAKTEDMNDKQIKKQIQQNIEMTEALKKMLSELDKKNQKKEGGRTTRKNK